jgi:biopolymer transport protein ExbD
MKYFGESARRKTGINITSLIDVIFMLVIFFMIGASFEKPSLGVQLPDASTGEVAQGEFITISVDAAGRIYADGTPCSREELLSALLLRRAQFPALKAALECDAAAAFGTAASVMDTIRQAGVPNVAIRHDYEE